MSRRIQLELMLVVPSTMLVVLPLETAKVVCVNEKETEILWQQPACWPQLYGQNCAAVAIVCHPDVFRPTRCSKVSAQATTTNPCYNDVAVVIHSFIQRCV